MYKNIEKNYRRNNPENKLYSFYWKCSIIIMVVAMIFSNFRISNYILLPFVILSLIICIIIYEYKNYRSYDIISDKWTNFFATYKSYLNMEKAASIETLVKILSHENINTKGDILLVIDYYNKKMPINIRKSIWETLISLAVTLASFIVIFVDEENKTIDYSKMTIVMESVFGVILVVVFMYLMLKLFISLKKSNESFYSELVDKLTIIYVNYNKYKYKLKEKNNFKETDI